MLTRLRDAYRRWRRRRWCAQIRETMFELTGVPTILDLSDEELQEGLEAMREVARNSGVSAKEAAAAIEAFREAWEALGVGKGE